MLKEEVFDKPLVIVGEEDAVLGFRALGFEAYVIKELKEFRVALAEILRQGAAICLVQENIYNAFIDEINSYRHLALPVFIPFAKSAKTDLLDQAIKDIRLRATGTL